MPDTDDGVPLPWPWGADPSLTEDKPPTHPADAPPAFAPQAPLQHRAAQEQAVERVAAHIEDSVAKVALRMIHAPNATARDRNKAASLVLRTYGGRLRHMAARRLGLNAADVEEVLQDTILAFVWRCKADCAEPEFWLIRVALNAATSRWRSVNGTDGQRSSWWVPIGAPGDPSVLDLMPADRDASDPLRILLQRERQALLKDLIPMVRASSAKRAAALSLLLQGCSIDEIARRLLTTPGAVRDLLYRVRSFLRDYLKATTP
jgi:DNA-directed RNA polymerase specialized sigma24 family protein